MSLIQISKIEYITLEQFIPNWTEIIKEMDEKGITKFYKRNEFLKQVGLDYGSGQYCLVGEANHFSRTKCETCRYLSYQKAQLALEYGKEIFQDFKLHLFTHMLEAHPQLMIK